MQRTPSELQTNTTVLPGASNISGFYLDGLHRSNVSASSDVKDWAHMPEPLQYFVMFVCGFVVCAAVFSVTHYQLCAFASQRLHDKMFQFVLGAKAQFFDSNPIGEEFIVFINLVSPLKLFKVTKYIYTVNHEINAS